MSTILLVDDEHSIRLTLSEILQDAGHSVYCCEDGQEALNWLEVNSVEILLSDICMPKVDGIDLSERVREDYPDTMIILFTGQGTLENATHALRIGVFDYLLKPVSKKALLDSITRVERVRKINALNHALSQENEIYRAKMEDRIQEQSAQISLFSEQLMTLQDTLHASLLPRIRSGIHKPLQEALKALASIKKKTPDLVRLTGMLRDVLESSLNPFQSDDPFSNPDSSLQRALQQFADTLHHPNNKICIQPLVEPATKAHKQHLFYALREAIHNALLHSNASSIVVDGQQSAAAIRYRVNDNGQGFSAEKLQNNPGMGLLMMKERAKMAGGEFNLTTKKRTGTSITITLPTPAS